jgi:acyl-CoA dehydrogenase
VARRQNAKLALVSGYLTLVTDEVTALRDAGRTLSAPEVQIHVKTLKILAAERTLAAVDALIELVGPAMGYLRTSPIPLERNLRDLRSATLNYADDRLLIANGTLVLPDKTVTLL